MNQETEIGTPDGHGCWNVYTIDGGGYSSGNGRCGVYSSDGGYITDQGDGYGGTAPGTFTGGGHVGSDTKVILEDVGVPEYLYKKLLPLTVESVRVVQDFAQAETQEQRDAILGILELLQLE